MNEKIFVSPRAKQHFKNLLAESSLNSASDLSYGFQEQLAYVALADALHTKYGITGSVAEIGLFLGDYFHMIASCAKDDEFAVGIDLFEDQEYNIDGSGIHDKSIQYHQEKYLERVSSAAVPIWIQADSLYLDSQEIKSKIQGQSLRLVSIDGGHSHYHLVNDLLLVESILAHGGVVIIDDYTNAGWPGVAEGVARYFLLNSRRTLAPFFSHWNKLLLTTESFHDKYLDTVMRLFDSESVNYKRAKLFGFDVIHGQGLKQLLLEGD